MPLTMAAAGEEYKIVRISGRDDTIRFLNNLGFVVGAEIRIVTEMNGNIIVNIKESRVAIGKDMAKRIAVA